MSPLCLGVALALVITVRAHGGVPAPLTRGELKALCTIDASATQTCVGYIAGVSDELSTTVWHLGDAKATALVAPCPGNQMAELLISLLTDLDAGPNSSLSDPALPTVQFILHPPLGCRGSRPALPSITVFADGARLKAFCTGSDRDERLQCEGYIRAVADMTLRVLLNPKVLPTDVANP